MHGFGQRLRGKRRQPRALGTAPCTDLGDDEQVVAIRVQGFADQLIRDVRAVEVARVDMVDAQGHGLAQYGKRRVAILGWAEDAGAGELHGAIAEAVHLVAADGKRAGLNDERHGHTPVSKIEERVTAD